MAQPTNQAKLCPHCANSIALDAVKCPYCKKELSAGSVQDWIVGSTANKEPAETRATARGEKRATKSLAIAAAVLLLAVFAGVVWFGQRPSGDSTLGLAEKIKELQEKEQTIKTLEAELAKINL